MVTVSAASPGRAHDPDRAWAELFVLAYSPVWMLCVGAAMATGWVDYWGDGAYLAFGLAMGLPMVGGPMLLHRRLGDGRRWSEAYWLKLNLWVGIVVTFGTYFGTHYFFDLMGMRYGFPVGWTLQARVVGHTGGSVPLFMYPLTQAYFMTYFVGLTVAWRWARTRFGLGRFGTIAALVALSYGVAAGETILMANDLIGRYFAYADRTRMIGLGSLGYMIYFVIGVPMLARMDRPHAPRWTLGRVALEALATCMLILWGLELWAQAVGPL